jgi:hypothetical protein
MTEQAMSQGLSVRGPLERIRSLWANPLALGQAGRALDAVETITAQQQIIEENPLLKGIFRARYLTAREMVLRSAHLPLPMVELSCGPSHIDRFLPGVVKMDRVDHPNVDQVNERVGLPYGEEGLAAILSFNAPGEVKHLFAEAERTLAVGGRLILVERGTGDAAALEREFPRLRVRERRYHGALASWLSGGLFYRPLAPRFLHPLVYLLEGVAKPLSRWLGAESIVEIEKI